jgi:hypothetical protein
MARPDSVGLLQFDHRSLVDMDRLCLFANARRWPGWEEKDIHEIETSGNFCFAMARVCSHPVE